MCHPHTLHLYSGIVGLGMNVLGQVGELSAPRASIQCTPQPQFQFLPQESWMLRRLCPQACHLPSFASLTTPMFRWSGC